MKLLVFVSGLICAAQTITPLPGTGEWLSAPMISPDGAMLAYSGRDGIAVVPVAGGRPTVVARALGDGLPGQPRWSPDGRQIAFLRHSCAHCESTLYTLSVPGGREKSLGPVCSGTPAWTPDGRALIATEVANREAGCDARRIVVIPTGGGPRVRPAKEGDAVALSADGKRLAYAVGNAVKIVRLGADFQFAEPPVKVATEPHGIDALHWTPDGGTLIYQVRDYLRAVTKGQARLLRVGTPLRISQVLEDGSLVGTQEERRGTLWRKDSRRAGAAPEKVRAIPWTDRDVCVSPDGQWQAFVTSRNGPAQIWVSRMDGSDARVLVAAIPPFGRYGDNTVVAGLSWSPDGRQIAIGTEPGIGHGVMDARLFVVAAGGGTPRKVADLGSDRKGPRWSADGRGIYVVKYSDRYEESFFGADVGTGRLTPVRAGIPAESGAGLYFTTEEAGKARLVKVRGVPR